MYENLFFTLSSLYFYFRIRAERLKRLSFGAHNKWSFLSLIHSFLNVPSYTLLLTYGINFPHPSSLEKICVNFHWTQNISYVYSHLYIFFFVNYKEITVSRDTIYTRCFLKFDNLESWGGKLIFKSKIPSIIKIAEVLIISELDDKNVKTFHKLNFRELNWWQY